MVNGRRKGNRGELEVAILCESWWRRLEPDCKFRRTPGSGGWGGKFDADVRAHFKVGGDLMTTAKYWPFTVEVKWRESWSFEGFLFGKPSPVWAWWAQARAAALVEAAEPLLFFRNRQTPWLLMTEKIATCISRSAVTTACLVYGGAPLRDQNVYDAERLFSKIEPSKEWSHRGETRKKAGRVLTLEPGARGAGGR